MNENKKYFKVDAICGHVGRKNCIIISFPIKAEDGKQAAKKAREFPRVKHDHKFAILNVEKITSEEYIELKEQNKKDKYLMCHSIQEQNMFHEEIKNRIIPDPYYKKREKYVNKEEREKRINYKRKKVYYKSGLYLVSKFYYATI